MNIRAVPLIWILLLSVVGRGVHAADATLVCTDTDCTMNPSGALFSIAGFAPGQSVTRTIDATNARSTDCELHLNVDPAGQGVTSLVSELFTVIAKDSADVYGSGDGFGGASGDKTIKDIFFESNIPLGVLPANSTQPLAWTITFNASAGNVYQGIQQEFDADVTATCPEVLGTASGGFGDEQDCCPGPDEIVQNAVQKIGKIAGATTRIAKTVSPDTPQVMGAQTSVPVLASTGEFADRFLRFMAMAGVGLVLFGLIDRYRAYRRSEARAK